MKTSSLLSAAKAMLALANAQTTATSTSSEKAPRVTSFARPFFIYGTHPTGSLEASVVAYERTTATYEVVCPTADAACQKEGYWPANVTHIEGSSWVGSNTATSGIVKYWDCRLGNGGGDVLSDQYGRCHVSTSTPSLSTGTMDEELPVNTCCMLCCCGHYCRVGQGRGGPPKPHGIRVYWGLGSYSSDVYSEFSMGDRNVFSFHKPCALYRVSYHWEVKFVVACGDGDCNWYGNWYGNGLGDRYGKWHSGWYGGWCGVGCGGWRSFESGAAARSGVCGVCGVCYSLVIGRPSDGMKATMKYIDYLGIHVADQDMATWCSVIIAADHITYAYHCVPNTNLPHDPVTTSERCRDCARDAAAICELRPGGDEMSAGLLDSFLSSGAARETDKTVT
ncbi:hypothetical protein CSAL01_10708 [Colletotrichum salicis]|uniref:Uncharacterized protein n=1 Tax=Colletotrichum salicis TaxID=1209931 RepID=A0A135V1D9_9PEZI|nr:hypothetical protein CSAL01_10708 [Colletotrichum salicis]